MCLSRSSLLPEIEPMSAILRSCVSMVTPLLSRCGLGAAGADFDEVAAESEADSICMSPWRWSLSRERLGRDALVLAVRNRRSPCSYSCSGGNVVAPSYEGATCVPRVHLAPRISPLSDRWPHLDERSRHSPAGVRDRPRWVRAERGARISVGGADAWLRAGRGSGSDLCPRPERCVGAGRAE